VQDSDSRKYRNCHHCLGGATISHTLPSLTLKLNSLVLVILAFKRQELSQYDRLGRGLKCTSEQVAKVQTAVSAAMNAGSAFVVCRGLRNIFFMLNYSSDPVPAFKTDLQLFSEPRLGLFALVDDTFESCSI